MGSKSLGWSACVLLGTVWALAAACSSDDSKKHASPTPTQAGSSGAGDADGGAPSSFAGTGGTAGDAGAATQPMAAGAGGDNGGSDTLTDGWLSGSRLRAVLDVVGGARRFKTWHDQKLDIDCDFQLDSSGVQRCLPGFSLGYGSYADDHCTQPVVVLDAGKNPAYVLAPQDAFVCGKGQRYLEVGAELSDVTQLFSNSTGTCSPNGEVGPGQTLKKLGAALPDSQFVAETARVREMRDARLEAVVIVAEDGARQVVSHFDLTRKAVCNPREHQGDGFACVPDDRAYVQVFFADAACKTEAAYHPAYAQQVCANAPAIVQNSKPNFTDTYAEVGAKLTTGVYTKDGASCSSYVSPGDRGASYYLVGDPVSWSSFPQLSTKQEGSGRILLQVLRGPASELVSREAFFDSTFALPCQIGPALDGKDRCLPRTTHSFSEYSDAKCSQGVLQLNKGQVLAAGVVYAENGTSAGTVIAKIGAKLATPAQTWQLSGAECEAVGPASDSFDYYAATPVPPADLALATREVE